MWAIRRDLTLLGRLGEIFLLIKNVLLFQTIALHKEGQKVPRIPNQTIYKSFQIILARKYFINITVFLKNLFTNIVNH